VQINSDDHLAFDSQICAIGHYPNPTYTVNIVIDFEANWLLNKYDVVVRLNDTELGALSHGEGANYSIQLPAGIYHLTITSAKDEAVFGSVEMAVNSNTRAAYHISCHSKQVEIEETEFTQAVTSRQVAMPYSFNHYLRKDYAAVVAELKQLGFTKISTKQVPHNFWLPSPVNSVVSVSINNIYDFTRDSLFSKSAEVTVNYHIADFEFTETAISVTEKDTFELPYTMTSGDRLDSLTFEIDHPEIVQRNEDGSFTALIPGIAKVTVSSGGHVYSSCIVEVEEIIVPIENIRFEKAELDVIVGSTFELVYQILPENANYTDITITISNPLLEQTGENRFYVCEAGDTEIAFFQDDRMLGTCSVHATVVEIEELVIGEYPEEMLIGDTLEFSFGLIPGNATNKGISVVSSNPKVAEVAFDERGTSVIHVKGLSAGSADITITLPNGTQYVHNLTVQEILPVEIQITNAAPNERIEVGTPVSLVATWMPENTSIKELTWTSSNSKIIRVNEDEKLEAVGVGTADITAKHKSGVSATITLTVEPTLVTKITLKADRDISKDFLKGNTFTVVSAVYPENATNQTLKFTSSDESVVKVSDKGVVTAVGVGTATITASSPDGPVGTLKVTVFPSPQKFRITWSAQLIDSNHVGSNWSKSFEVNDETFSSGSIITVAPDSEFTIRLTIQDNDSNPDTGYYFERFAYSIDLCTNGYTVTETVYVKENGGRYSGNRAEWKITVTITPVK
jgi:uncharacterized protein YjdB